MNKEIEFINAVKELEVMKAKINDYSSTALFIWTSNIWRIGSDQYNEDMKKTLARGNKDELYQEMQNFELLRPFLGNDLWHLYKQYFFFLMRLRTRVETDFKRKELSHWKNDLPNIKEILDQKYHHLLDIENDYASLKHDAIHAVKEAIENDMVDKIDEKMAEFKPTSNVNYSGHHIVGDQNTVGNNNTVKNEANSKVPFNEFAKDHPIVTAIALLLSAASVFLTLVQMKWINL